jgi:hypothetical protein
VLVKGFVHGTEEIGSLRPSLSIPDNFGILPGREILIDGGTETGS